MPSSVIITLVGIALTAWLLPAFTRQWDDRQKAHDLKAAITNDMATATAQALFGGKTRYQAGPNGSLLAAVGPTTEASEAAAIRQWELSSFQIEAKLRANFTDRTISTTWREYSDSVRRFFLALTQPTSQRPRALRAASLRIGLDEHAANKVYLRALNVVLSIDVINTVMANLRNMARRLRVHGRADTQTLAKLRLESAQAKLQLPRFRRTIADDWRAIYASVEQALLSSESRLSVAVLAAHPTGYSTTWHDLLRDLVQ